MNKVKKRKGSQKKKFLQKRKMLETSSESTDHQNVEQLKTCGEKQTLGNSYSRNKEQNKHEEKKMEEIMPNFTRLKLFSRGAS